MLRTNISVDKGVINRIILCQPFPCLILSCKAKFACYSRYLLTSYICILVSYDEKDICLFVCLFVCLFWCQFQKVLQVFIEPLTSASSASVFGAQTWITAVLNVLPWKQTEIILSFLRLHPSTAFQNFFVDYVGFFIFSKGILATVVDIMVI